MSKIRHRHGGGSGHPEKAALTISLRQLQAVCLSGRCSELIGMAANSRI